ncbi:hypothetical protein [Actinoplanes sp. L3-i22]|uniref:hypothetical protein n=1 Tax=Actinoplanes sp. L3-i22 TaxID=2836373 RepID=UPI001C787101|nr:hypothetical protein [Actinoplanes sp. L3-i22]BCY13922.1 hypothetical protein L3i22_090100 [Actinoplanes sp. L3-i22]
MDQEQILRDRLAGLGAPPSVITIDWALPAARRRARRRRRAAALAGVGTALAVGALVAVPKLVLGGGPAPGPALPAATPTATREPVCTVVALPLPSGATGVAGAGVDPTGRYILGHTDDAGQDFHPVLWTDGVAARLSMPTRSVQLTDVNSAGVVVGLAGGDGAEDRVFRYAGGRYTMLKMPSGNWHPYPEPRINEAGDVLINAEPAGNSGGAGTIVLLWPAGSTTPTKLPLPKGASGHDLADDGSVVGGIVRDGVVDSAWVWDRTGKGHRLSTPKGKQSSALAVSGDWVTGGIWESGDTVLWDRRTGAVAADLAADSDPGIAVNAAGLMIDSEGRLIRDGRVTELPAGGAGRAARASAVSDSGLVVGVVTETNGDRVAGATAWQC